MIIYFIVAFIAFMKNNWVLHHFFSPDYKNEKEKKNK